MNEFGDTPSIYIWPQDHIEGEPFPQDFMQRVGNALSAAGIEWETT